MIEMVVEKAIDAAPALVVLVVLVLGFLKYLKFRDARFAAAMEKMGAACHVVQERATEAIKNNTAALETNAKISGQTLEALRRLNGGGP